MNAKVLTEYRRLAENRETDHFHPKAALSTNHNRFHGAEEDHRLPYKRDVDRIIHSKAYARYIDKTQVVYLVENDHLTHRNLHVQLVSNFARGIAEILQLNLDLVEAIALGHDVGHPPFGHEGEGYLSKLSQEYAHTSFTHPWQSCRLLSLIEPLNLGLAVYDGFLCHDGGIGTTKLLPRYGKTWEDHFQELEQKLINPENNIIPGTLEGCLVKLCDTMSYLGRDIEDAISIGIISRDQIPNKCLGKTNGEILTFLARDMISQSYEKDYIALSQEAHDALSQLRAFNFQHIYMHPKLKVESTKVERSYRLLFEFLFKDYQQQGKESFLWKNYLLNKPEKYLEQSEPARLVVDYISGMTDNFFVRTLEKIVIPKRIQL